MSKLLLSVLTSIACCMGATFAFAQAKTPLNIIICGGAEVLEYHETFATEFEQKHPNVDVIIEAVAWGKCEQKTLTLASAGDAPDAAYLGTRNIKMLANAGYISPVSIPEKQQSLYQPGILKTVSYQGKLWAYPRAFSTKALYLNCDIFKQADIACVAPKTWEELYATAKAIKEKTGLAGMGLSGKNADNTYHQYLNYLYSNDGEMISSDTGEVVLDSKNALEALEFYGQLVDVAQKGATAHDRANLLDLYNDGKLAMYIQGPWGMRLHTKIDNSLLAPLPDGPSGKGGSILVADAFFVFKGTGNEALAEEFLQMLSSIEKQYEFDHPDRFSLTPMYQYELIGIKEPYYKTDTRWQAFIDGIPNGGPEPMMIDYKSVQDIITNMLQGIILQDDTAENLLETAIEELQELE